MLTVTAATSSMGDFVPRKVVLEVEKRDKIDLVKDRRPRYVDPELLPALRVVTLVETMSKVRRDYRVDI